MSETFRCDDKERLVAFLYGDLKAESAREVERHLRTCAECTAEVHALQGVRHELQSWVAPETDLGFAVVQAGIQTPAPVLTSPRWAVGRDLPAWAQVAAALLVLGVSAAVANLQVRSTPDGVVVTTGWMAPAAPAVAPAPTAAGDPEWRQQLAALEQTLRAEMAAQPRTAATAVPAGDAAADAVLRRVQALIEASEERQRQELAMRLTLAERSWNQRRTADWAAITQRMSTLQGRTFAVEAGQQEMINRLRRVSLNPPNQ